METIRWDIYNFIDRKDKLRGNSMRGEEGLERFVKAQKTDYAEALSEIKNGHKESHWIWYIFPQMRGLGYSIVRQIKRCFIQHFIWSRFADGGLNHGRLYDAISANCL